MLHYLLIKPTTGELMGETRSGLVVIDPTIEKIQTPKLLASMHVAENHQSAMNCDHGGGWEIATVDLFRGIIETTKTLPVY